MRTILAIALVLSLSTVHAAQPDRFAEVVITAVPVGGSVTMLRGAGGNLAVSIGADGTLLVDDQFAPLAKRIHDAIDALGGGTPRLIINTHFHGDHVGGNGEFGQHGVIVAQEHVRYRLLDEPDQPRTALPLITFSDRIRIAFNDDTIDVIHLPNGHTDGDSIVWFRNANVLHMGDLFFNGSFPYIDIDHGGSVTGYIDNVAKVLEMIPADTRIIPGHGALANVVELAEYHEMLTSTVAQISTRLASGERIEDIEAAGLGAQWAHYGEGSITAATWIKTIQKASDPTQPAAPSRR